MSNSRGETLGWLPLAFAAPAIALAAWLVVLPVRVFAARFGYPMDLEWMEGGTLYHAHRLFQGLAIYGPPSAGFLPFPYPPLHFAIVGLAGLVAGLDYPTGRAVSIACMALTSALLFREVLRQVASRLEGAALGLVAVASIAAGFPAVDGWYDLVRNDAMAIALPVWAACVAGASRLSRGRLLALALLLTASVYTKQTGAFFAAWIGLWVLARDWRSGLWLAVLTLAASVIALVGLQLWTDGWFWTWLFLLGDQSLVPQRLGMILWHLFAFAPFLAALPLLVAWLAYARRLSARGALWAGMLLAALLAAVLPAMKPGGYFNNYLPVVVLAGPVALVLLADAVRALGSENGRAVALRCLVFAGSAVFLFAHRFAVEDHVPSAEQWREAVALGDFIGRLHGGVLIPSHPFLAVRADPTSLQLHRMPYTDAHWAGVEGLDLDAYVDAANARWLILDGDEDLVDLQLRKHYGAESPLPVSADVLVGYDTSPRLLLERRTRTEMRDVRTLFDFEAPAYGADWRIAGDAFAEGPTEILPRYRDVVGLEGARLAGSYHSLLHERATGSLTSPPFVIDRSHLALLVGGGSGPATRVELQVDGEPVRTTSGGGRDTVGEVTWDVGALRDRRARIVAIDEATEPGGIILLDDVRLLESGATQ